MAKTIIYARKSTESEDRQILSIDSQVKELQDLARREGIQVSEVLRESKSAKMPGRPVFNQLMADIGKGKVGAVVCWKLDRLARNPVDGGALIWAFEEGKLQHIHTPGRTFFNTGNDKFWMQLEFGMAKKYVDDLSDNTKRGLRTKAEMGWMPGPPALGYMNDTVQKTIVKDPERFRLLRRVWELMLTGNYSVAAVWEIAAKTWGIRTRDTRHRSGVPLPRTLVYEIFQNPFYYGVFTFSGQTYQGKHPPMVTKEEFAKVQAILAGRSQPRPKRYEFAFTGLIRCGECGAGITAEHKTNRYGSQYVYYHCSKRRPGVKCQQGVVQDGQLEKQIVNFLETISLDPRLVEWVVRMLDKSTIDEQRQREDMKKNMEDRLKRCSRELDELLNLKLRGVLTDEEFVRKREQLQRERIELEGQFKDVGPASERVVRDSKRVFQLAGSAVKQFSNGTPEEKKRIVSYVGSNFVLQDRILRIQAEKPFDLIQEFRRGSESELERFEPGKFGLRMPTNPPFGTGLRASLRLSDDVRTFFRQKLMHEAT